MWQFVVQVQGSSGNTALQEAVVIYIALIRIKLIMIIYMEYYLYTLTLCKLYACTTG